MPARAQVIGARLYCLVIFGVSKRFGGPVVPANTAEDAQPVRDGLPEVVLHSILQGAKFGMQGDGGNRYAIPGRVAAVEKVLDRLAIIAHVRAVVVEEDAGF